MSGSAELPICKQLSGYCTCGHSAAAHGSKGFICAVCPCREFEPPKDTFESEAKLFIQAELIQ
jgi:hypothetical protein